MHMLISPMLLESQDNPFSDPAFIFEPKMDGHRLILIKKGDETRLFTREQTECTRQYPELHDVPVEGDVILDGEVCCIDPDTGASDFELVMERLQLTKREKIHFFAKQRPVHYVVWDILQHKGRDLRNLSLMKRRSILESVMATNERFHIILQVNERGEELYNLLVEQSMQGMVAKKKDSPYVSRRSHDWLKIMNYKYEDVWITGYRKEGIGWLAEVEDHGRKRPVGMIESDISPLQKKEFYDVTQQLITGEDNQFVYIQPLIKAKVKFYHWTRHGFLRKPSLVELKF